MKFKVGDKVVFNKENEKIAEKYGCTPNKAYEIVDSFEWFKEITIVNDYGDQRKFNEKRFELVEPKRTKNQRITALEKEMDELKVIVHQLRESNITIEDVKRHFNIGNTTSIVEDKPKTPNQLRAEIIEKAKMFIENTKLANHYQVSDGLFGSFICDVEFVVNEQKRTVVALMRSTNNKSIKSKGIAKCHPQDVFNEHIGKAIALGRALGLDVSEFEQAVQPNEIVIGMKVSNMYTDEIDEIINIEYEKYFVNGSTGFWTEQSLKEFRSIKIINDTNAIYGGC